MTLTMPPDRRSEAFAEDLLPDGAAGPPAPANAAARRLTLCSLVVALCAGSAFVLFAPAI